MLMGKVTRKVRRETMVLPSLPRGTLPHLVTLVAVFFNEEAKLDGYFRNVKGVADRIVVVDCSSTDRTAEICRKNGATVVKSPYRYFEQNVNRAMEKVETEWVLILDADERLSRELKAEIRGAARSNLADVCFVRRINYLFDGFSTRATINNFLPRLFRKGAVRYEQEVPHEIPAISGRKANISGLMYHYAYPSLQQFLRKTQEYLFEMPAEFAKKGQARISAGERNSRVKFLFGTHGWRMLLLFPLFRFVDFLVFRRLALDGMRGLGFSFCAAINVVLEELAYWEAGSNKESGAVFNWNKEYPER